LTEVASATGARFRLVGAAPSTVSDIARPEPGPPSGTATSAEDPEQLAEALRGVMLRDGYEYREAQPPVELARKILAERRKGREGAAPNLGTGSNLGAASAGPDTPERDARDVFGSDNRVYKSNNTSFPYRTLVWSEKVCSGFMIGPGTMLSAAHCVYDTANNAWHKVVEGMGQPARWPRYAPGVDGRDAVGAPYGWQQCYDVTIPTAYVNETSPSSATAYLYDFAVFDFTTRCGVRPGDATGWMGTWIYSEGSIEGFTTRLYGYPGTAVNGIRTHGSPPNFFGEIWGMSGSLYIDSPTTALKTNTIDSSVGQSGSPYWTYDSDYRAIGVHVAGGPSVNHGRRWDIDVYNFVDAYSPYPQQQ
jgi:glutamyl endopeptidase